MHDDCDRSENSAGARGDSQNVERAAVSVAAVRCNDRSVGIVAWVIVETDGGGIG